MSLRCINYPNICHETKPSVVDSARTEAVNLRRRAGNYNIRHGYGNLRGSHLFVNSVRAISLSVVYYQAVSTCLLGAHGERPGTGVSRTIRQVSAQ